MEQKRFLAIIPARYASTRFPGKPLAILGGMTVIERVYRQVIKACDDAVVATDDERILNAVLGFGGKAVMTSSSHRSGTDRCMEAYRKIGQRFDVVINVQGDEPFISPKQINALKACFDSSETQIATLVKPFDPKDGFETILNPNSPKVVIDKNFNALYFSRSVIPFIRGVESTQWPSKHTFYKHIGIYAFLPEILEQVTSISQGELEKAESLEQLRWLENGFRIKVGISQIETIGIDTPEDLRKAEEFLLNQNDKL
ncbi:MAG: 3-deoxy-manno-octulosonate cytidylyltransferase [Alistipes sp.]|nr:3-deoxy-manno-octulosonate cytidylyltransferase [Candidatus Alistipes equi]